MNKLNYVLPLLLLSLIMIIPCSEIFSCVTVGDEANGVPCCLFFIPDVCDCELCSTIEAPLDGGLSALLIAGVAYGAKKVRGKLN